MTDINKLIIKNIREVIEDKYENIPLKSLNRFLSYRKNLKSLAKDIRYVGIEQFEKEEEYLNNLKNLFKIIIEDKDAILKDVYEKKIIGYKHFTKLK